MFHWVMDMGAMAYLLPTPAGFDAAAILGSVDGLLLTGGVDISPSTYNETAMEPAWSGDRHRDDYELALLRAAIAADIPVLGVCRGAQLINVAFGGSMYQDITTQVADSLVHRDWDVYDKNTHEIDITPGSGLDRMYPGRGRARVNSVHHQGIKTLGKGLSVEAKSPVDGVIEAIRLKQPAESITPYVFGIQWHPEWIEDQDLLHGRPILEEFLAAIRERQQQREI